jgi:lipopolysaccharide transport system ATP-binding protein
MSELAISAHGLGKRYRLGTVETGMRRLRRALRGRAAAGSHWALQDLTFDVREGETVALVGRNGAGKSTLLKVLSRITEPTTGYVDVRGRVGALLEIGTGFHGDLTGRENIFLNGSILGMSRSEVLRNLEAIIEFAGVSKHIDTPVKWYSSGMYVRLAFAIAAHLEPEILIVDEVLAVGDAEFQRRCIGRMSDVAREGRTVVFVSHNMQIVRSLCERSILLESGRIIDDGKSDEIVRRYLTSIEPLEAGQRVWTDPATRPGDDDCRLVEVRVADENDEAVSSFFSSQPIDVVLEFDVLTPDPGLIAAVELVAADGTTVFRSYSLDGTGGPKPGVTRGRHALRCAIPPDLLNAGRYVVNVRIHGRGIDAIVNEPGVVHLDVMADHGESHFIVNSHGRPGVVAPVLAWAETEPRDSSAVMGERSSTAASSS